MPWKVERRKDKFVVVRENGKVVAEHESKAKAMRQVRALYASEYWLKKEKQKQFASRSEAGRYAANMRWQNGGSTATTKFEQVSSVEYGDLQRQFMAKLPSHRSGLKPSESEMAAQVLDRYLESSTTINSELRFGKAPSEKPEIQAFLSNFDRMAVSLPKNATVFRGLPEGERFIPETLSVGETFVDKGITSTSISSSIATGFAGGGLSGRGPLANTQIIEIRVPKGTPVLAPENRFHDWEGEILIKPETEFRLVSMETRPTAKGGTYTHSIIEIVTENLEKGRFGSRSEAGRYAANIRWQGTGMTVGNAPSERFKDMTHDEYRELVESRRQAVRDFQENATDEQWNDPQRQKVEKVLRAFPTASHETINEYLRKNSDGDDLEVSYKEGADLVKDYWDDFAVPLKSNARLYRGFDIDDKATFLNAKIGQTFTDLGIVSTSTSSSIARKFQGGVENLLLEIKAPKGTRVLPISGMGEYEVALRPQTKFQIVGIRQGRRSMYENETVWEVEIVNE